MRLLLIDDDRGIALAISSALSTAYHVDIAASGQAGIDMALVGGYDLVVLDLILPDMSGLEVCQKIRQRNRQIPILVLSGDPKVMSKIKLFEAGADDYLTKPFSLGELKGRLQAIYRRVDEANPKEKVLTINDLVLDSRQHIFERAGQRITLRRKEFALMECLMQNAGSVVTRERLSSHAWRLSEDPWTNTIDVHIKHLRDKIDKPFPKKIIKTIHGLGYKLDVSIKR